MNESLIYFRPDAVEMTLICRCARSDSHASPLSLLKHSPPSLDGVNRWEGSKCKMQENACRGELLGQRSCFKGGKWPFCAVVLVEVKYGSWPDTENEAVRMVLQGFNVSSVIKPAFNVIH